VTGMVGTLKNLHFVHLHIGVLIQPYLGVIPTEKAVEVGVRV